MEDTDWLQNQLNIQINKRLELKKENERLRLEAANNAPAISHFNVLCNAAGDLTIQDVAKMLGYDSGPNKLYKALRNAGVFLKNNTPYQKYINDGSFRVIETYYKKGDEMHLHPRTLATTKGVNLIKELIKPTPVVKVTGLATPTPENRTLLVWPNMETNYMHFSEIEKALKIIKEKRKRDSDILHDLLMLVVLILMMSPILFS